MRNAVFCPGPGINSDAGWTIILNKTREALVKLDYTVIDTSIPPDLPNGPSLDRTLMYDLFNAEKYIKPDLFVGALSYSTVQMIDIYCPKVIFVWSCHDSHRYKMLKDEYERLKYPYEISKASQYRNNLSLRLANIVTVPSNFVYNTYKEYVTHKLEIVRWGVDYNYFTPNVNKIPDKPYRVLFVGGDPVRKGLWYLLHAISGMSDVELWIVGPKTQTEDTKLNNKMKDLGYLNK